MIRPRLHRPRSALGGWLPAAGCACGWLLVASCALGESTSGGLSAEALRGKSSFTWNAEELAYGFARWDEVFPGRTVRAGGRVRALEEGPPFADFADGTPRAAELNRFMSEQNVGGLLVLHEGRIRLERYGSGHSAEGRWVSQSMAKSVTSTLVGMAIRDGHIESLDDPVSRYVSGLQGSAYDDVTVRHLLTMTSGVRWNEDYGDPESDIVRFYRTPVTEGLAATVSYMRTLERAAPPGEQWVYKTGETHLLGVLVAEATGRHLSDYLTEKIWGPYGMEQEAVWSTDRTGDELAGCCLHVALRDYARIGQFVLAGGDIDGVQTVPDGWLEAATSTQVEIGAGGRGYGYQWWTYPDGTFAAIGIHGQFLHIDRARRLLVVINSAWPESLSQTRAAAQSDLITAIRAAVDAER